jgi:hypothetical protein
MVAGKCDNPCTAVQPRRPEGAPPMAVSSPSRLTARLLDPPAGGVWPVRFAVEHLAAIHPKEVAGWLSDAYARWGGSDSGAAYLAVAARDCLPAASVTLLRALHDYPRMHRSVSSLYVRQA